MVGGFEPLEALQNPQCRELVVRRIVSEYPAATLASGEVFYRIQPGRTIPPNTTARHSLA
jgi:hypothetical protein